MDRMRTGPDFAVARVRPGVFLVLVAVLSVPFFVVGWLAPVVRVGAIAVPASAAMFVVPAVAAMILTAWPGGRTAAVALVARIIDRPLGPGRWYVVAVLVSPVVAVAADLVMRATGHGGPLPTSLVALPAVLAFTLIAATGEELGWTAYATDAIQRRHGPIWTGIVLGIFWGAWHLVPLLQAGHGAVWIGGWFAGTIAARVIIVALHDATGGVTAAILMHAMLNVAAAYTPHYDTASVAVLIGVFTTAVAVPFAAHSARFYRRHAELW
ncbi:hypothetical protein DFR68_101259 [Nocardia mexicana]|uniref:CAAX prenyl protease 2/Lysostaphin resistance protein A-like domain-containing protein n=2 Tax=Nocardia mexicana TaxID=279262 RepID=A0A370HF69_9NOCA|nr:hypothetical protein DFR68_101259 [Nocardia mexicana]